jgi:hypothetical protein
MGAVLHDRLGNRDMKSVTFAGQDERDIENQILKWRANNPWVAVKKIHPFKRADLVGTPSSFWFFKRTARNPVSRTIDYQD